jgi:hypothetical protein
MINKTTIVISGKKHEVEIRDGVRYVDGMTIDKFIDSVDPLTLIDLANVGKAHVNDIVAGEKIHNYQGMMDFFYRSRH